jgi:hypothetical protein
MDENSDSYRQIFMSSVPLISLDNNSKESFAHRFMARSLGWGLPAIKGPGVHQTTLADLFPGRPFSKEIQGMLSKYMRRIIRKEKTMSKKIGSLVKLMGVALGLGIGYLHDSGSHGQPGCRVDIRPGKSFGL